MTDPPDPERLPEQVRRNREAWDRAAAEYVAAGEQNWAASEPSWGIWSVPESELHLLPDDLTGRDAIELGCGTAPMSRPGWPCEEVWRARRLG